MSNFGGKVLKWEDSRLSFRQHFHEGFRDRGPASPNIPVDTLG